MREIFAVAGLLLLLGGTASAAVPIDGYYVGVGVGQATLELEGTDADTDFKGDDTAFKVIAGYRILRWFAVEANYVDYGTAEDDILGLNFAGEFTSFGVSAIGLLPFDNADLFARIGLARWDGEIEATEVPDEPFQEDNFDPVIGIGAQMRLGDLAIRAEAEGMLLSFDDDGDALADGDDWLTTFSVSVTWTF